MQVIVHIGTGKAGSTALQHSLRDDHQKLLERGCLFPTFDGMLPPARQLLDAITRTDPPTGSATLWTRIREQVEREKPEKLILSNEHLWKHSDVAATMHDRLRSLGGDVRVFLYIREPLSYYRSVAQQALRSTHHLPVPALWRPPLDTHLERLSKVFGTGLTVVPFQSSSLLGGEMLKDFAARALSDETGQIHLTEKRANPSPPAEVTEAVQCYQRQLYPDGKAVFRNDVLELERRLCEIAKREQLGTKAHLKQDIADTLLAANRDILFALRNDWGVEFDGIDYDCLSDRPDHEQHLQITRFSEICDVDPEQLERMMMMLSRDLLS